MRAGTLRERITVQRQGTRDQWGERTAWLYVGTYAASVQPIAGTETTAAEGVETVTKYAIKVRHSPATAAITTADRLVWRGKTIDIGGITPNERRTEIQIAGVAHG
jgi:head-tail adaptor